MSAPRAPWEWLELASKTWKPYNAAHTAALDSAWFSNKKSVDIDIGNGLVFECTFNPMRQTNKANGNYRSIRTTHTSRTKSAPSTATTTSTPAPPSRTPAGPSWEWWDIPTNSWKPYSTSHTATLDSAWFNRADAADIDIGNGMVFRCDFKNMTQTNKANGNSRRIRTSHKPRASQTKIATTAKWEWLDNDGTTWKPYSQAHTSILDKAWLSKEDGADVIINSTLQFRCTFNDMRQTNKANGNSRSIRTSRMKKGDASIKTGDPGSSTGATKVSPSTSSGKWEWLDNDGTKWRTYMPQHATLMDKAWFSGKDDVEISIANASVTFVIDFTKMTQTNKATGYSRSIRTNHKPRPGKTMPTATPPKPPTVPSAGAGSPSTSSGKWEWLDNDGTKWRTYMPQHATLMDKAWFSGKDDVEISIANASVTFVIDFTKMTQTNKATGYSRSIRTNHKPRPGKTMPAATPPKPPTVPSAGAGFSPPTLKVKTSQARSYIPLLVQYAYNKGDLGQQMLATILSNSGPPHWQSMPSATNCKLFDLPKSSGEYRAVEKHFNSSMSNSVVKIQRIQNRFLWHQFTTQKLSLIGKNKGLVNERMAWHGSGTCKPAFIYGQKNASGFDPRLGSGFYGVGAYFAEKARYSGARYAFKLPNGNDCLFLARVMTGVSKNFGGTTQSSLKRQPDLPSGHNLGPGLYDSVQGGPHRPTMSGPGTDDSIMYIVYSKDMSYPEYLVEYKRK